MDVATTGVDGRSRPTEESPDRRSRARRDQKTAKRGDLTDRGGLRSTPAASSRAGRTRAVFKDPTREQTRQKTAAFESQAKPSKVSSASRRRSRRVSTTAKAASGGAAYKADELGESTLARQSETSTPEVELGSRSPASREEDFERLSGDADLRVFNRQTAQGYRGVDVDAEATTSP